MKSRETTAREWKREGWGICTCGAFMIDASGNDGDTKGEKMDEGRRGGEVREGGVVTEIRRL
jgi:hypothetical protein